MKRLMIEVFKPLPGTWRQARTPVCKLPTIFRVPQQRIAKMGHMHPDLVSSPRFQPALDQRNQHIIGLGWVVESPQNLIVSHRVFGIDRICFNHRSLQTARRMAAQMGINLPFHPRRRSPYQRPICAFQGPCAAMIGKLLLQVEMSAVALGHDHDATGALVEAVHDARTLNPTNTRQGTFAVMQKRVDQCSRPIARRGMYNHASRLVDDDEISVLKQNVESNLLRLRNGFFGRWHGISNHISRRNLRAGSAGYLAVDRHLSLPDQSLHPGARNVIGSILRDEFVHAIAICRMGNHQHFHGIIVLLRDYLYRVFAVITLSHRPTQSLCSFMSDEEEPLDPAVEAVRVKMVRLLAVSGGIMMLGLMAVLLAIVYKVNQDVEPKAAAKVTPNEATLAIPAGSRVMQSSRGANHVTLTLRLQDNSTQILVYNLQGILQSTYLVREE